MCKDCGCSLTREAAQNTADSQRVDTRTVTVFESLMNENDRVAAHNRAHLDAQSVVAINLMSAPGSGKTRLLEATLDALRDEFRMAVIEGDLETENDAERIRAHGVPAVQITTGSACHLDAHLVHKALHDLSLAQIDLLFIENVGNLVCPAGFDLGQHADVVLLSATEGDDKPAKYPVMFRAADLVLLSKADLLAVLEDFRPERAEQALRALATPAPFLPVSAKTGTGLDAWCNWLRNRVRQQRAAQRQAAARQHALRPAPTPAGPVRPDQPMKRLHHDPARRHGR